MTANFLHNVSAYTSCLGHGGFGIVLKSIDYYSTESAIKFLFPTNADANEQKQILRETTLTSQLAKHPCLVNTLQVQEQLFSFTDLEEIFSDSILKSDYELQFIDMYLMKARRSKEGLPTICIQMELCGETLRSWLHEGKDIKNLEVQKIQKTIILNLVEGLKFLHDHKIIHRDLKPENIMFSKSGFSLPVKIGDFGLCRIIHNEDSVTGRLTKSGVGTKAYMAPEIRTGEYTQQADFFSLGLIIWEVAQFVTFEMFDQLVIDEDRYVVHEHPMLAGLPEVVTKLTKRSVKERFQTWHEVVNVAKGWMELDGTAANCMTVRNSVELRSCLGIVRPGAVIKLRDGVYIGPFTLERSNVTILGRGPNTVIKNKEGHNGTLFEIIASECTLRNVKFELTYPSSGVEIRGSKNKLSKIEFVSGCCSIDLRGDENEVTDIITSGSSQGIRIDFGNRNIIQRCKMENVGSLGIYISTNCDHNVVKNITGRNVTCGILVDGSYNAVTDVHFIKDAGIKKDISGIDLKANGSNNTVENFETTGFSKFDQGLDIRGENAIVKDVICEGVYMDRKGSSAKLTRVDGGEQGIRRNN
ncbi:extracellular signal-regulated kinase 7 [Folsomia candida]|uniref:Serine/threonine-protein kinase 35 n=1 Tax=Folsomia candida TaxID=158441 RepID=A0A226CUG0_FOLCA|nr:extracellular signal-regulated kinase 7 [Folsomia candida]XP_035701684.1 extracellular signal-regulated kinase 7 [Folsomia candida]OXA37065.1 Serine/threonine-protein kinase 35 [Folsomia candida]